MTDSLDKYIETLIESKSQASLHVNTLGHFSIELDGVKIPDNWGRDKAIQLFQFLLLSRNRAALHKEQIIDRLWEEDGSNQDFKVALHGINKTLEPNKVKRGQSKFIKRQGSSYQLNTEQVWIDSKAMEAFLEIGNNCSVEQKEIAIISYQYAVNLYQGIFLPNRIFEDWTTTERERLQMLALGGHLSLAELLLEEQANESIRLTEKALNIDHSWEEAYRIQMMGHMINGNRPQAIKTYNKCKSVLKEAYDIEPLPVTNQLYKNIIQR